MVFRNSLDRRYRGTPRPTRGEKKKNGIINWALGGGIPAEDLKSGDIVHVRNHVLGHDYTIPLDEVEGIARAILAGYRLQKASTGRLDHARKGE